MISLTRPKYKQNLHFANLLFLRLFNSWDLIYSILKSDGCYKVTRVCYTLYSPSSTNHKYPENINSPSVHPADTLGTMCMREIAL